MSEQLKNLLIGIFVIAACILIVSFIMFLHPSVGDMKKPYYVRFSNISSVSVGTRVTYAGKPVGEVVEIKQIDQDRDQPADEFGRLYTYELVIKVDSSVKIYSSDEVMLQTSGLLGEKSVAIVPKIPADGQKAFLIKNQAIYAESGDPMENVFLKLSDVADEMKITLQDVNVWIETNGDSVASAVQSFGNAMDEADRLLATFNNENIVYDVKHIMNKANILLDDINHYGLLFHLNKGWQRTHSQRINFINNENSVELDNCR